MESSSEEDKVEYIHNDLLRSSTQNDDDNKSQDSNLLFMSEPSMSEGGDSAEHRMRLLSPFSGDDDEEEEEEENYGLPPPPPPPANHQHPYLATTQSATSPENTSLSSWESPHLNARRMHFSPDPNLNPPHQRANNYRVDPYGGRVVMPNHLLGPSVPQIPNLLQPQQQHSYMQQQQQHPPNSAPGDTSRRSSINSSLSAVSDGQRHRLQAFLTDLRVDSQGQVQEATAPGDHTSLESGSRRGGARPDMNGILRRTVPPNQNSRVTSVDSQVTDTASMSSRTGIPADDTVVMTLSASEDEKESSVSNNDNNNNNNRPRLDSEQQHSADDEKTADRPARTRLRAQRGEGGHRRQKSGESGHRRQRSGDAAAATLLTGSKDWKGMSQDQIPLPEGINDDDDDDDDLLPPVEKQREKKDHDIFNNKLAALEGGFGSNFQNNGNVRHQFMNAAQFSQFAIGTGGNVGPQGGPRYNRRSSRRDGNKLRTSRGSFTEQELAGIAAAHNHFATAPSFGSYSDQSGPKQQQQVPPEILGPQLQYIPVVQEQWSHSAKASQRKRPTVRSTPPLGASPPILSPRSQFVASVQDQWSPPTSTLPGYSPQISQGGGTKRGTLGLPRAQSEPVGNHGHQWGQSSISSLESSVNWFSQQQPPLINTELNYRPGTQRDISPLHTTRNEEQAGEQPTVQDELQLESDDASSSSAEKHANINNLRNVMQGDMSHPTRVVRHSLISSPFANFGKTAGKADRRRFMPQTSTVGQSDRVYPTYICPLCKTQQREFFTVSSAPHQFESASGYIALYFGIYVVAALYIFGLEVSR
jgi:hypothetical protein